MDLESVNDSEAGVVLSQTEVVLAEIGRVRVASAIKTERAEIDILVLRSHTPVIGDCVLQTAAYHPADLRIVLMASLIEDNIAFDDFLTKMNIACGNSAGDIRQPFAERLTETPTRHYQIIRSKRRVQVAVSTDRTRWGNRPGVIGLIQPGVTNGGLDTEPPVILELVVVADQTAGFKSAR